MKIKKLKKIEVQVFTEDFIDLMENVVDKLNELIDKQNKWEERMNEIMKGKY